MQQRFWRAVWRIARLGLVLSALLTALALAVSDVTALMRVARYE
jgi:hypothetical protein